MCEIIDDFTFEKKAQQKLIDEYRDKLPKLIIQIWEEYGFGSFMDGFLRTIDPNDFQGILERAYFMGEKSIPVFVTALGDMIVWEDNAYLTILRFRHGTFSIMEKGCTYFLDDLTSDEYIQEFLKPQDYYIALRNQGILEYDECFGYVPLLCLGGLENANCLKKVKLVEHMELILAIAGPVV